MIKDLLYICGAPGVGKSTLMRHLRMPWDMEAVSSPPVPHILLRSMTTGALHGLELGALRDQHPGTDSLAMDISHRASDFLIRTPVEFALGEGARLATRPFLERLVAAGVRVHLVYLQATDAVLDARCDLRGTNQNYTWRKGASTRARNVAEWASAQSAIDVKRMRAESMEPGILADLIRDRSGMGFLNDVEVSA